MHSVHAAIVSAAGVPRARHIGVWQASSGYAAAEYARSYDLIDLLDGSEGTLAIFVGVELSLMATVRAASSGLGAFATLENAVDAAVRARENGAVACELLDRTF